MKNILAGFFCLLSSLVFSQTNSDTTIYTIAESMPFAMLAACQPSAHPGWNIDSVRRCSEIQLMSLVAQNINYPIEARDKNIQGMVVTSFVVETNGRISNLSVLKDIGGGCGPEALRVLKALDEAGMRWVPAKQGEKFVRARMSLPLKFRLEEAKPYVIAESGDTLYTQVDVPATFRGGLDSLASYIYNKVVYPPKWADSCKTGVVEMSLLVYPNGEVKVDNQLDFSNLGVDFQFNAIRLANRSTGLWVPAQYGGKNVATSVSMRVPFKSPSDLCTKANDNFDKAILLADEAVTLSEQGKTEEALAKLSESIVLQPNNTELIYYRGNMLIGQGKREEACTDFTKIKSILGYTWFENFGRLICGW